MQTQTAASFARPLTSAVRPSLAEDADLTRVSVHTLARWCAEESRSFYRHESHDPRPAYELFRRALVERNEDAWEYIYQQYLPLVEHWVRRTGAFTNTGESSEYFVSAAFARFWRAIPANRFVNFPNLASLLNYLRRCAGCVVIDSIRAHSYNDLVPEDAVSYQLVAEGDAEDEVTERLARVEFWNQVTALLNSEAERVLVYNSFIMGMKPGAIFEARPDLYESIDEVYTLKRNVLTRLRRSSELKELY
jgi:DNA-directed RNA polymerase specialized sigma24 family protein